MFENIMINIIVNFSLNIYIYINEYFFLSNI